MGGEGWRKWERRSKVDGRGRIEGEEGWGGGRERGVEGEDGWREGKRRGGGGERGRGEMEGMSHIHSHITQLGHDLACLPFR